MCKCAQTTQGRRKDRVKDILKIIVDNLHEEKDKIVIGLLRGKRHHICIIVKKLEVEETHPAVSLWMENLKYKKINKVEDILKIVVD